MRYISFYIRPHLDYGDVYDTPGNICKYSHSVVLTYQMEKFESVQYSAAPSSNRGLERNFSG